jgi:hypothetical protein
MTARPGCPAAPRSWPERTSLGFASDREAASRIAVASAASFFFSFFTKGLTVSAAINFTV